MVNGCNAVMFARNAGRHDSFHFAAMGRDSYDGLRSTANLCSHQVTASSQLPIEFLGCRASILSLRKLVLRVQTTANCRQETVRNQEDERPEKEMESCCCNFSMVCFASQSHLPAMPATPPLRCWAVFVFSGHVTPFFLGFRSPVEGSLRRMGLAPPGAFAGKTVWITGASQVCHSGQSMLCSLLQPPPYTSNKRLAAMSRRPVCWVLVCLVRCGHRICEGIQCYRLGAQGLGAEVAAAFGRLGARLILSARRPDPLKAPPLPSHPPLPQITCPVSQVKHVNAKLSCEPHLSRESQDT